MARELKPTDGAPIAKNLADQWMKNYQHEHPEKDRINAHFFGRDIIERILAQDKCIGIRIYYGLDDKQQKQLLLVGACADGSNIWPKTVNANIIALTDDDGGVIGDASMPCPPYCPPEVTQN
ncbi:hypothetical protein WSM22_35000 [Cytophagales bacterium WSM2-2]|nr:hypothetical protein WSM22_35000 [Cytophagales bacterium WSM2-2]